MNTWESMTECHHCGEFLRASGSRHGGDVYHSCTYCGWFSEEDDSESTYLNLEPTKDTLVHVIDLVNYMQERMRNDNTDDVYDLARAIKLSLRTNVSKHYQVQVRDDDGEWSAMTDDRFATHIEARMWAHRNVGDWDWRVMDSDYGVVA